MARQSLESRLADAAAASSSLAAVALRSSVENVQNSPATSLSPFTKSSTTVRRTSTSRYNVNGEVGDPAGSWDGSGRCVVLVQEAGASMTAVFSWDFFSGSNTVAVGPSLGYVCRNTIALTSIMLHLPGQSGSLKT